MFIAKAVRPCVLFRKVSTALTIPSCGEQCSSAFVSQDDSGEATRGEERRREGYGPIRDAGEASTRYHQGIYPQRSDLETRKSVYIVLPIFAYPLILAPIVLLLPFSKGESLFEFNFQIEQTNAFSSRKQTF